MRRLLTCSLLLAASMPAPAAATQDAVDAVFARYSQSNTPGCAVGVFKDGEIAYERGYGLADLNQNVPITPETVFYIASTSKQFTAFAVALLAEKGALSLEDPIRKHVPELPAWADGITVDQLVHHTSGIPDYLNLWEISGRSFTDEIPLSQAVELVARQKNLTFSPGSAWGYSNSNYLLLAEIVARVTGTSLRAFAQEAMFAPLGMTSTGFHDDPTRIVPRRAEGYVPDGSGGFRIARTSFALVGDGGLLTNVRDLLKWDANFYDNRLEGGQAFIDRIVAPGTLADGKPLTQPPYAFGLQSGSYRGLPAIQHSGGFIGFSAQLVRFPTERLSVAVLCNDISAPAAQLAIKVADLYLAGKPDPAPAPAPRAEVSGGAPVKVTVPEAVRTRWMGRYYVVPPGIIATVAASGDGLEIRSALGTVPLTPTSDETFTTPAIPGVLRFTAGQNGVPSLLIEGSAPASRLEDPPTLDAQALAAYVGRYESGELDTWFEIRTAEGALEMRRRYRPSWEKLEPIDVDRFTTMSGPLRFSRGRQGDVVGFRIGGGRIAEVQFEKSG